jgi:hypothetical protein
MLIFVEQISERLLYTLDFVFNEHGLSYQVTNDVSQFIHFEGNKLNYSNYPFEVDVLTLLPSTFLFEESYHKNTQVSKQNWFENPCLEVNYVVDPLAAIFYVLSRYEEYAEVIYDQHERFPASKSLLVKYGWIESQIVEHWTAAFLSFISNELYMEVDKTVRLIPTFDVDNTFAHLWKEGWRTWLSLGKDLVTNNLQRKEERKAVVKGLQQDPYDSFETIRKVLMTYPQSRVFWHVGDYGKYDTNVSSLDPRHQALIQSLDGQKQIGLHPSYKSNHGISVLFKEKERLKSILDREITESRQHFLKLRFPTTFERNLQVGLKKDYTIGFAEVPGFRSGTSREHAFFNVLTNTAHKEYRMQPFCYMDGTLLEYNYLSISEARDNIKKLFVEVTRYGGNFSFIWHNDTLAEAGKWKGWKEVFNYSIELYETYLRGE